MTSEHGRLIMPLAPGMSMHGYATTLGLLDEFAMMRSLGAVPRVLVMLDFGKTPIVPVPYDSDDQPFHVAVAALALRERHEPAEVALITDLDHSVSVIYAGQDAAYAFTWEHDYHVTDERFRWGPPSPETWKRARGPIAAAISAAVDPTAYPIPENLRDAVRENSERIIIDVEDIDAYEDEP